MSDPTSAHASAHRSEPPDPTATFDAPALEPPARPGDMGQLGRYRVLRVLGRGGMGVVYEAEDDALGRRVALKVLLPALAAGPAARRRFAREARAAARVEHDHIVPVYDIAETNGVTFLALPLLVGETLSDRLRREPPPTTGEVLTVGRHVAEGLAAAHAAGLVHRDVKPSNVWLERTPEGAFKRARLFDFGLARAADDEAAVTGPGAVMGTPAYMAPEQARGEKVDHRADLFSLGCVLYQMATGARPFGGGDALAVFASLANDTPLAASARNPQVPAALSALIDGLLAKNPDDRRPRTARQAADQLARIAGADRSAAGARPGASADPDLTADLTEPLTRAELRPRRSLILLAAGVAALACGVVAFALTRDRGRESAGLPVPPAPPPSKPEPSTPTVRPELAPMPRPRPLPPEVVAEQLAAHGGDLIFRNTFDDPSEATFGYRDADHEKIDFKDGVCVWRFPKYSEERPSFSKPFGPACGDVAFVCRLRAHAASYHFAFRMVAIDNGNTYLNVGIDPDGTWNVARQWTKRAGAFVLKRGGPEPELVEGRWVTLAVRSAGPTTEVWVNGKLLTTVTESDPPVGEPASRFPGKPGVLEFVAKVAGTHACGYDFDYLSIWKLPPVAKE